MFAFVALEILEDFVTDLQALEMNDTNVFGTVFPDLALLKFERHLELGKLSLRIESRRDSRIAELLFLAGGLLAGDRRFFLGGGAAGFGIFLAGFLLGCFGGFISHDFYLSLPRLTRPRNRSFPEGTLNMLGNAAFVNDAY